MKKVTLKSDVLWKALDLLKKYTSKNGALPILDDTFYFNVSVNQIELISNQLSHCGKVVFPAQSSTEFCGVLQFSRLYQFLDPDLLPPQPIVITLNDAVIETVYPYEDSKDESKRGITRDKIVEENRAIVDYQNGKTKSSWEDCLDYPQWVKKEEKKIGVLEAKTFLKTLDGLQIVTNFGKTKVLYYDNTAYFITNTAYDKLLKLKQTETIEMFLAEYYLKFTAKIDDYSIEYYLRIQDSKNVKDQQEEVKKATKENKLLLIENYFASEKKINEIVDNKKSVDDINGKLQELKEKYKKASYVQISGNNYFEKVVKVNPKGLVTSSDTYSLTHPVQTIIYTDELNKYQIKPRMMRSGSKLVESEKMFEISPKSENTKKQAEKPSIAQRIADLKIILELDESDENIRQRIKDLELINSL